MYHYTFGHEYSEEGVPQFDSKHGEWSFDKRNYQRYLPPSPNPDPDPTPNTIPTPTPNPNPNPNQVPAAQPAAAAPLRPRGGARALQRAARTPHAGREPRTSRPQAGLLLTRASLALDRTPPPASTPRGWEGRGPQTPRITTPSAVPTTPASLGTPQWCALPP